MAGGILRPGERLRHGCHGEYSGSDLTPTPPLTFWALGGGGPWGGPGGCWAGVPQYIHLKMSPSLHWSF